MLYFLARVILFAIAISVIRSVVTFVQRAFNSGRTSPSVRAGAGSPAGPTMLQQDPVCGTYVAIDASMKKVVNGHVLHFCSSECRDKYRS
jgi:YHS domain-containing protein